MELVSIVTANYNGSRYLAQAIESVLRQSHEHFEHIIVDDGSTDGSRQIIDDYCARDSRIKAIYLPSNRGVAAARNEGIAQSAGAFLTFLDADDTWDREKIRKQVAVFHEKPEAGLVVTDASLIDEHGRPRNARKRRKQSKQGRISLLDYLSGKCLLSINAMTRRECLDACGHFNPNYVIGEDYELWMRITREYEYYFLNEALHHYRIHGDNATRDKLFNRESKIKILEEMIAKSPQLVAELGRGFQTILQRKYNSLGKAYYLAGRHTDAAICFEKALELNGNLLQQMKARLWQTLLRGARSRTAV